MKAWLIRFVIERILARALRFLNDVMASRAAREVEARQKKQEDLDARPPDSNTVDDRLGDGSA